MVEGKTVAGRLWSMWARAPWGQRNEVAIAAPHRCPQLVEREEVRTVRADSDGRRAGVPLEIDRRCRADGVAMARRAGAVAIPQAHGAVDVQRGVDDGAVRVHHQPMAERAVGEAVAVIARR